MIGRGRLAGLVVGLILILMIERSWLILGEGIVRLTIGVQSAGLWLRGLLCELSDS